MSCVRVGGLEAFATDISIPLKYGVDQCVGDTICAGGILYGQRNIPVILDFCKDIREVAAPGALFINYANPMAMNTWAALAYGGVNTVGLCHGVQHGAHQIAQVLGVTDQELDYVCSGINHQTWYIDLKVNGRQDREGRADRRLRASPGLLQAGEGPDRRSKALRRLFDREQRPPLRIPALVPQAPERDQSLDRHERLDPRRDRRLSPLFDRAPQLVRDRFPAVQGRRSQAAERGQAHPGACLLHHRGPRDRPRLSRPFQRPQQRHHPQPPGRRDHRKPRLRRSFRSQHGRGHHAPDGLRRHLLGVDLGAAPAASKPP